MNGIFPVYASSRARDSGRGYITLREFPPRAIVDRHPVTAASVD